MGQHLRTGRPTRAEAAELEQRLRQAALEAFSERGFEGATMEEIARAAGISKRTLYLKYPDKRALFAKVLPWAMSTLKWDAPHLDDLADDLPAALLAIARTAVTRATDPQIARLTRIAMAEARHFPEFAEAAHSMTWSPRLRSVAEILERHASTGAIVVDDTELAAEHFLAMVSGFPAMLAAFGMRREPDDEEHHLEHAVRLFLSGLLPRDTSRVTPPERSAERRGGDTGQDDTGEKGAG